MNIYTLHIFVCIVINIYTLYIYLYMYIYIYIYIYINFKVMNNVLDTKMVLKTFIHQKSKIFRFL